MKELIDFFNEKGIKNKSGGDINYNSIQRMLNNRRYIGEYAFRDIVVPDGIPAIVPKELFDRVQAKLAKNKKSPARHKAEEDYLLTTKLFCGCCGAYMCGESGKGRSGEVHRYYKCVSIKKRRTICNKKSVRKDWIEDIVVNATMKMLMSDTTIDAIVSALMTLQDAENVNLPLYEKQLKETNVAINNLLNAIQAGILNRSTKERFDQLEATRDELENKIAVEKLAKPRITEEQLRFFLDRFRKLDVRQLSHRRMLIDTFINAVFLYDDKLVLTYNFREETETITFDDLKNKLREGFSGSDMSSVAAPAKKPCDSSKNRRAFVIFNINSKGFGALFPSRISSSSRGSVILLGTGRVWSLVISRILSAVWDSVERRAESIGAEIALRTISVSSPAFGIVSGIKTPVRR